MSGERQRRVAAFVEKMTGGAEGMFDPDDGLFERMIRTSPYARDQEERDHVRDIHRRIRGEVLSRAELGLYEAIVLPTGRPAWFVENDRIVGELTEPWTTFEGTQRRTVERALPSIGCVELEGTRTPYAGTAFVVGPGLLMTNRHVARVFARGAGYRAQFLPGCRANLELARERRRRSVGSYPISKVVMIHPYWDMALLAVEGLPAPVLQLAPVSAGERIRRTVALVGYPNRDWRNPADAQARIFGEIYGVKRVLPGEILGRRPYVGDGRVVSALAHDASTLGGCSGSAVIDAETGHVIGLHFAGEYAVANYAVPAEELALDPRVRDAGVQFTEPGRAGGPCPWDASWTDLDEPPASLAAAASPRPPANPPPPPTTHDVRIPIELEIRIKVHGP